MNKQILKTAVAFALGEAAGRGNGTLTMQEEIALAARSISEMYPAINQEDIKAALHSVFDDFKNMPKVKSH